MFLCNTYDTDAYGSTVAFTRLVLDSQLVPLMSQTKQHAAEGVYLPAWQDVSMQRIKTQRAVASHQDMLVARVLHSDIERTRESERVRVLSALMSIMLVKTKQVLRHVFVRNTTAMEWLKHFLSSDNPSERFCAAYMLHHLVHKMKLNALMVMDGESSKKGRGRKRKRDREVSPVSQERAPQDLDRIFDVEDDSDFTFIIAHDGEGEASGSGDASGGERRIYAHTLYLKHSSHTTYFRSMLDSRCKETDRRELRVTDSSYAVFRAFLRFIYDGTINLDDESADFVCDLFRLSDKYRVAKLSERCLYLLQSRLHCQTPWSTFWKILDRSSGCDSDVSLNFVRLMLYRYESMLREPYFLKNKANLAEFLCGAVQEVMSGSG